MKKHKLKFVSTCIPVIIGLINYKYNMIGMPGPDDMVPRQIDFITISTIFAGFSFTTMGLLLGLSSEKMMRKIENTNIVMDKIQRIIDSIIFFMMSVAVSMLFVLGVNQIFFEEDKNLLVDNILYFLCVGYLIGGIVYFVRSVYELYDLLKCIYKFNVKETNKLIAVTQNQLESTRNKMHDMVDDEDDGLCY